MPETTIPFADINYRTKISSIRNIEDHLMQMQVTELYRVVEEQIDWTNASKNLVTSGNITAGTIDGSDITGTAFIIGSNTIDEFSTDGTLGDDSDSALPTEKAVKTYVDGEVASAGPTWNFFELDGSGDLQPKVSGFDSDAIWELDGNDDIQPQA